MVPYMYMGVIIMSKLENSFVIMWDDCHLRIAYACKDEVEMQRLLTEESWRSTEYLCVECDDNSELDEE